MRTVPLILCASLLLGGCAKRLPDEAQPVRDASDGVAGVVAHTESAERHVQSARPHSDDTGKVYLGAASVEHREVLSDAAHIRSALDATQKQLNEIRGALYERDLAYERLQSRWYVVWGRRLERALWLIGISWLVLGVASVVLGMGNPLGWGVWLGKEIVRLIPAMNVFAWIRNWLQRRRDVRVADLATAGA